jgi:hypothetical protein
MSKCAVVALVFLLLALAACGPPDRGPDEPPTGPGGPDASELPTGPPGVATAGAAVTCSASRSMK